MNIALDLRNTSQKNPHFSDEILLWLASVQENHTFTVYGQTSEHLWKKNEKNFHSFFAKQWSFLRELKKWSYDLVITFEDDFPVLYRKNTLGVIHSLENILYPSETENKFLTKYVHLFLKKKNLKNFQKIVCFSESTKKELNEKFNLPENKIHLIPAFFPNVPKNTAILDVKSNLWIQWNYFLYDYTHQNNHNLKRLLEAIKIINQEHELYLVILGSENANNKDIRELVVSLDISSKVIFAGNPSKDSLGSYYTQSLWVLYPTIYNNFPFQLKYAVWYEVPILASETEEIEWVFWDTITYFSPISVKSMVQAIKNFSQWPEKKGNYKKIQKRYNSTNFVKQLLSLI